MLHEIGSVYVCLLGTDGFHVMARNKRFTAAVLRCHGNCKYENFTLLFGRLCQKIAPKCVLHLQHDYFSLFNQSNHWCEALSLQSHHPSHELSHAFFCSSRYLSYLWFAIEGESYTVGKIRGEIQVGVYILKFLLRSFCHNGTCHQSIRRQHQTLSGLAQ